MGEQQIAAEAYTAAPREAVWRVLADLTDWRAWGPWHETSLLREGKLEPNGPGALRRMCSGRYRLTEEVVALDAPERFSYELRAGLPLRDYRADVLLSEDGASTRIRWQARFRATIPGTGWLARRRLQRVFDDITVRLAREAERQAGVSADASPAPRSDRTLRSA
jgi:uncharacterized protein YndB with AHSA1/START domain